MDKDKNESKFGMKFWAGLLLIGGVGTFISCIGVYYCDHTYFDNDQNAANVGTFIAGTAGVLISGASVLYFIHNLILQRKSIELQTQAILKQEMALNLQRKELSNQIAEMKQANETSKFQQEEIAKQTSNNFFFNLLENNKKLVGVMEITNLNAFVTELKSSAKAYMHYLSQDGFNSFGDTSLEPTFVLNDPLKVDLISTFIANVVDIIKFIADKLKDDELYHRMFFNQLSYSEKYLISFCSYYKLLGFKGGTASSYNYLSLYKRSSSFYDIDDLYFPSLSIHNQTNQFAITITEKNNTLLYRIKINKNYQKKDIKLNEIKIKTYPIENNKWDDHYDLFNYEATIQINKYPDGLRKNTGFFTIYLPDIYKDKIKETIDVPRFYTSYKCELAFIFNYNNSIYTVGCQHTIHFNIDNTEFFDTHPNEAIE